MVSIPFDKWVVLVRQRYRATNCNEKRLGSVFKTFPSVGHRLNRVTYTPAFFRFAIVFGLTFRMSSLSGSIRPFYVNKLPHPSFLLFYIQTITSRRRVVSLTEKNLPNHVGVNV